MTGWPVGLAGRQMFLSYPASNFGGMTHNRAPRHRILLALGLFFLAPLVGEFLLGNQPITALPSVLLLAPMYGGGALLIREIARRAGRGWATIALLAAAYGLIEEGPIDQMLWNPHYGGFDMGATYASTHVPLLGTSVQTLQDVLSIHAIWSICVPIAIVEAFGRNRTEPWLGKLGLSIFGAVFLAGSVFLAAAQVQSENFMATPWEFLWISAVILGLIVTAFVVGRRPMHRLDTAAPRPWVVGVASFAALSLYWCRQYLPGWVPTWAICAGWVVAVAVGVAVCLRWSRSLGFGPAHIVALAGGALLTYAWVGFQQSAYIDAPRAVALFGNVVFAGGALVLLFLAARAVRSERHEPRRVSNIAEPVNTEASRA